MGFECQSEIESSDGGLAESRESAAGIVGGSWNQENRKAAKKAVLVRRTQECIGVPKQLLASRLMKRLGRIEVHAC
jgi:hypothetical protein